MVPANTIKAVVFDCDGILVDSEPLHYQAFQEVLAPLGLGHDYSMYVERYIGFDDREAFVEVFRDADRSIDPPQLENLIRTKNAALLETISKGVSSFPGVVELVHHLVRRQVPLAVASGALRTEIEGFLRALGLEQCFSIIVAADDVQHSKPDPETYVVALRKLQGRLPIDHLEPGTCVAIEDTPAGIQSAKQAGLFTIGVTHSFNSDQLHEADFILETLLDFSLEQLAELVQST